MHDESATGNDYFKCDFCLSSWSEDRPMVEGHKGSLICNACLGLAHRDLVVNESAWRPADDASCTLCLMTKPMPHWASPVHDALVCHECVVRAATTLRKDPDTAWAAPG